MEEDYILVKPLQFSGFQGCVKIVLSQDQVTLFSKLLEVHAAHTLLLAHTILKNQSLFKLLQKGCEGAAVGSSFTTFIKMIIIILMAEFIFWKSPIKD
ncbi:hypothetical protein [Nostoc sp.]|uniref:hypothetical protein n=1 Tax=Nostoc sp. TaxID=1180 RepID=UPI002FF6C04B